MLALSAWCLTGLLDLGVRYSSALSLTSRGQMTWSYDQYISDKIRLNMTIYRIFVSIVILLYEPLDTSVTRKTTSRRPFYPYLSTRCRAGPSSAGLPRPKTACYAEAAPAVACIRSRAAQVCDMVRESGGTGRRAGLRIR